MKCKILRLLLRTVPACFFSIAPLTRHINDCTSCRAIWESDEEFRVWLDADEGQDYPDIQPQVMKKIRSLNGKTWPILEHNRRRKAWAVAMSFSLLLFLALFFLEKKGGKVVSLTPRTASRETFALVNAKMDGKPVTPYIYRLKKQKMILVWCERGREKSIN